MAIFEKYCRNRFTSIFCDGREQGQRTRNSAFYWLDLINFLRFGNALKGCKFSRGVTISKGHKSPGSLVAGVFVIVFLMVRSCLLITLIKSLKGHKSLTVVKVSMIFPPCTQQDLFKKEKNAVPSL